MQLREALRLAAERVVERGTQLGQRQGRVGQPVGQRALPRLRERKPVPE